ncbi:MAG TPA: cell wall-binding repeat-containing protein [Acidimicrobiales bacterium]
MSVIAAITSLGGIVALGGTASAVITGSTVALSPPATVTTVFGGVPNQPVNGWTITMPLTAAASGDKYTIVVNPHSDTPPDCATTNDLAFAAVPTVTATSIGGTGGSVPTFTVGLASDVVEPACSGLGNELTLTVASVPTTPATGTTAWAVAISGIKYNIGAGATPGAVDTSASTCTNNNAAACTLDVPANASVSGPGGDVNVVANTPPVGLLAGADTNVAISNIGFQETVPGAIPAGPVCVNLGAGTFDTSAPAPTITVGAGPAITTGVTLSGGTASFIVVTPSTAPTTYVIAGLRVDAGNTPGPVTFTASSGGTCATPTNNLTTTGPIYTVYSQTRTAGSDADATAAAEMEAVFPTTSCTSTKTVVLATDSAYPDALSASYLAGQLDTSILLTPTAALSSETANAIRQEGIATVDIVGGPLAVGPAVVSALQSTPVYQCGGTTPVSPAATLTVNQIYGQVQYDTSAKIAQYFTAGSVGTAAFPGAYGNYNHTSPEGAASSAPIAAGALPTAIVATGEGYQDATAASVVGYAQNFPVILTTPTTLASQASASLVNDQIKQVILMGGPVAVSDTVVSQIQAMGISVLRIAGQDFTQTAAELALFELNSTVGTSGLEGLGWDANNDNEMTLARGDFYSDALAGSAFAADLADGPQPILLTTDPNTLGTNLTAFLNLAGSPEGATGDGVPSQIYTINVLGGTVALPNSTLVAALQALAAGS